MERLSDKVKENECQKESKCLKEIKLSLEIIATKNILNKYHYNTR